MNIPGDFTQPLFLGVKTDPQTPILDQLRALKYESHQAMAYSNLDFKDLLVYSGVGSYQAYFTRLGDVVIDSTDVDAATLNSFQGPGRSLFFKTLTDQSQAPEEGQAISTLFFQILKMEEQIHLITTFRENLFEKSVVENFSRHIIRVVEYMVGFPTKTVSQMVASIGVPGFPITPGGSVHPGISLTSRPEKKKEVPMDRPKPLGEFKDKTVIRMLEQLEKGLVSIEEVERVIGGNDK